MSDPMLMNADQVRMMASVARLSIVSNLRANGPQSISQLSKSLGIEPKGLYYHVKAMCDVGLVRVSQAKVSSRRQHAIYELVAQRFVYDTSDSNPEMNEAIRNLTKAILRQNGRLWDHAMSTLAPDAEEQDALFIETVNVRLSNKNRAKLAQKIAELSVWAKENNLKSGGTRVVFTAFSCPVKSKLLDDGD